jgi:hypothetical protein
MTTTRIRTVAALCCTLFLTAGQSVFAADNCAELLNSKCTECHNLNRVCQKVGKKDEKRWARTISRMEKHGTKLSAAENKGILACLAEPTPSTLQLCK